MNKFIKELFQIISRYKKENQNKNNKILENEQEYNKININEETIKKNNTEEFKQVFYFFNRNKLKEHNYKNEKLKLSQYIDSLEKYEKLDKNLLKKTKLLLKDLQEKSIPNLEFFEKKLEKIEKIKKLLK